MMKALGDWLAFMLFAFLLFHIEELGKLADAGLATLLRLVGA